MDNEDTKQNNPEKKEEKNESKSSMVEVVNNFVLPPELKVLLPLSNPEEQYIQLQELTQKAYWMHFESSGIADKIRTLKETSLSPDLDLQALKIISDIANQGESAWKATFPNTREPEMGMDCTMASAMLKLALGELGFSDVRTVLRSGHYEVMRETGDKKIRLYDPATRVTPTGGITSGYSREFEGIDLIPDNNGGLKFAITLDQPDMPGGIGGKMGDKFIRNFYAEPIGILVDVAIVLSNVDFLNKDAQKKDGGVRQSVASEDVWQKQAVEIINKYPSVVNFDYQSLKAKVRFSDPYDNI